MISALNSGDEIARKNSAVIDVRDVQFAWNSAASAVLDIGKFTVEPGERLFVEGPSGCGKSIIMPGYVLPLEYSGKKVTEFLLVPWVGACIQTPPPPANQIIHVVVNEKNARENKGLFEPVNVTVTISTKMMIKSLYLVGGSSGISIGYALQASMIEPYSPKPNK